jgi:hypothetical protein
MKLASHNSWSFNKPAKWYMKPFQFIAKCQSKNIKEQYNAGVRLFDLRVRFVKKHPYLYHGTMCFGRLNYDDLEYLDKLKDVTVRVMLEFNSEPKDIKDQISMFRDFVINLTATFCSTKFVGGRVKYSWETVVSNLYDIEPDIDNQYSSAKGNKIDNLYPKAWADKNNTKVLAAGTTKPWLMMDFI